MATEVWLFFWVFASILAVVKYIYSDNEKRQQYNERSNKISKKTGMEKIKELKNRLANLAMTDDRPAVWRICRSLVESLDEIENEHFAEMESEHEANTALRSMLEKADLAIDEQTKKIQEADDEIEKLEEQLKAMSDLANSAMADAQKWQNAYLNLRVETPLLPPPLPGRVWYLDGKPVDESLIMSQQAETARKAQEERFPRNGYRKYHIKFLSYKDGQYHETNLWCGGIKDVEDWVTGACGGDIPIYVCEVVA